jgi:hypothetical protein
MIITRLAKENIRCGVVPYLPNKWGKKEKRIEMFLCPYFSSGNAVFSEAIKNNTTVINTFNFFGRGGRDDPPDSLAVIAEMSRSSGSLAKRGGKRYLVDSKPNKFNTSYGGIY